MCLYPKLIFNRKYIANKKNGGNIPPVKDTRVLYIPVGCGKCIECMKQKAREWNVRLHEELKDSPNRIMVTFTFNNESIAKLGMRIPHLDGYSRDNGIAKIAVRHFLEKWRRKYGKSVKHWLVTELGHEGTENIHLHGILFTDKTDKEIDELWEFGFTRFGTWVNSQTINYIVKYINKPDIKHKEYKPKILCSAGIGGGYLLRGNRKKNEYNGTNTREYYTTNTGHRVSLPKYYRNNIYSDDEREKLWGFKLDEQTIYVLGEKVDVSKGTDVYNKLLEEKRVINRELGYGDASYDWERKRYEREMRNVNYKLRTEEINNNNKNN